MRERARFTEADPPAEHLATEDIGGLCEQLRADDQLEGPGAGPHVGQVARCAATDERRHVDVGVEDDPHGAVSRRGARGGLPRTSSTAMVMASSSDRSLALAARSRIARMSAL